MWTGVIVSVSVLDVLLSNQDSPERRADLSVVSTVTLTSFLYPYGPTKSDFSVFLPGNGRRELAVKSRVTGKWTLLKGALDQESPGSIPGGAIKAAAVGAAF